MKEYKYSMVGSATGSYYTEDDIKAVVESMRRYNLSLDYQKDNSRETFEKYFASYIGVKYAASINSGNCAMDLILKYLELRFDDEIISCGINFHGTHQSIIATGARLVLCDVDEVTLNLKVNDMKSKINQHTKAIVVTQMNGLSADMDQINKIIDQENKIHGIDIKVIVDAARSCGAKYKDRYVGNDCWAAMFSFQAQKQISTLGEGGMIVTNDIELYEAVKSYSCFGSPNTVGTCYRLSKTQCSVGLTQLSELDKNNYLRQGIAFKRNEVLNQINGLLLPFVHNDYYHIYSYYTVILPDYWKEEDRDRLQRLLLEQNINCPLRANTATYRLNPFILKYVKSIPHIDNVHNRILTLPIHFRMSKEENEYIIKCFYNAFFLIDKENT